MEAFPSQSFDIHSADVEPFEQRISPEHRLLVAIIRRALWDFALYKQMRKEDPKRYELAEDAAGWLFWDGEEMTDEAGRYTFLYICRILEVDPRRFRSIALSLTRDDIHRMNTSIEES